MTSLFSYKYKLFSIFIATVLSFVLFGCNNNLINATIDDQEFKLEIAKTVEEKARGLSGRKKLNKDSGMIFLYNQPQTLSFWMKDTLIPLQIIFVDGCTIVDIQEMGVEKNPSNPTKNYMSQALADKAIELNSGSVSKSEIGKSIAQLCN